LTGRAYRAVSDRRSRGITSRASERGCHSVSILWIILIIVLVLLLLGFFSRGRW
jgi:flagellar basal body-associated protein FliL